MDLRDVCPWGNRKVNLCGVFLETRHKKWLANLVIMHEKKAAVVARFYNLKVTTLKGWVKILREGKELKEDKGRPQRLSSKLKEEFVSLIDTSPLDLTKQDALTKLHSLLAAEEAAIKGIDEKFVVPLSTSTIRRRFSELGIKSGNAEVMTDARFEAVQDARNAIWVTQ